MRHRFEPLAPLARASSACSCAQQAHFSLPFPLNPCATVSSPLRRWQGLRAHARLRSKLTLQPPFPAQPMRHCFETLAPLARASSACLLGLRTGMRQRRGSEAFWLTVACMCLVLSVQMSGLRPAHTCDLPDNLKYSKWDHIEVSDDEGDSHPNIDQKLMARLKKEKRQRDYEEFRCCARQKLDAAWQRRRLASGSKQL
jgi:hypothetical protein